MYIYFMKKKIDNLSCSLEHSLQSMRTVTPVATSILPITQASWETLILWLCGLRETSTLKKLSLGLSCIFRPTEFPPKAAARYRE